MPTSIVRVDRVQPSDLTQIRTLSSPTVRPDGSDVVFVLTRPDVEGNRYIDALAGYSALNFGHRHPDLVQAAKDQLDRSTLTSRAFHNDQLGPFCAALAKLVGKDMILPMNTGA